MFQIDVRLVARRSTEDVRLFHDLFLTMISRGENFYANKDYCEIEW